MATWSWGPTWRKALFVAGCLFLPVPTIADDDTPVFIEEGGVPAAAAANVAANAAASKGGPDEYDYSDVPELEKHLAGEPQDSSDRMVEKLKQELELKRKTHKETSTQVAAIKENLDRALKLQASRRKERRKQKRKQLKAQKQKELLNLKLATEGKSVKGYMLDRVEKTQSGMEKFQQQRRAETEQKMQRGREITKQQFKILDKDKNGKVSPDELETVYQDLKTRRKAGEKLTQFEGTLLGKTERGKNSGKDYFKFFDNNNDSSITLQEYTGYDGLKKHKEFKEAVKGAKFDL